MHGANGKKTNIKPQTLFIFAMHGKTNPMQV